MDTRRDHVRILKADAHGGSAHIQRSLDHFPVFAVGLRVAPQVVAIGEVLFQRLDHVAQGRHRGRHLAAMAEHQCKQDGFYKVELVVQFPHGVDHAQLKDLGLRDLLVVHDGLDAVLHILDGVLVHRGTQIHRADIQAVGFHPGGVTGLHTLLNGQVGHAAGGDLHHDVAHLTDVGHRFFQQAQIRGEVAVQVAAVQMHHGRAVFVALIHIPGNGPRIDENVCGRNGGHGDHDFFHWMNTPCMSHWRSLTKDANAILA